MRAWIPGSRLRGALLIASFVVLAVPGSVAAHAELIRPIPADGETVTEPVTVVSGRYSQDLADNSRLVIRDATGASVATGGVVPDDARRMVARPASPLADGTYEVQSTSVSAEDGDIERVTWTFTIAIAATASPSPTDSPSDGPGLSPSPEVTPSSLPATASPAPTASSAPGDSTSGSNDVILPIVAALAIVAVGAGFLLNRNRSPRT